MGAWYGVYWTHKQYKTNGQNERREEGEVWRPQKTRKNGGD